MQLSNVILKGDSQIIIQAIMGKIKASNQISNPITNIVAFTKTVKCTIYLFNRIAYKLTDNITEKTFSYTSQNVLVLY